ncbi:MAG: AAA family ATPase [Kiloniellales bacterium]|nr:AAA family ATPase [Kiloniellales bacterium]
MQVLTLASRKGGSGKTTLAGHLAVQCEREGDGPVAIIDLDPQGSIAEWWNVRESEAPLFVRSSLEGLQHDLDAMRSHGVAYLIIDTPPALNDSIRQIIELSDLVLIPTRPSPHDLRSIGATVDLVEHVGKPLIFVINSATRHARITCETVTLLSQHGPLAPSIIHHRVDFASSMVDGRTVMELPTPGAGAEEIARLWDYLRQRLNNLRPAPLLPFTAARGDAVAVG